MTAEKQSPHCSRLFRRPPERLKPYSIRVKAKPIPCMEDFPDHQDSLPGGRCILPARVDSKGQCFRSFNAGARDNAPVTVIEVPVRTFFRSPMKCQQRTRCHVPGRVTGKIGPSRVTIKPLAFDTGTGVPVRQHLRQRYNFCHRCRTDRRVPCIVMSGTIQEWSPCFLPLQSFRFSQPHANDEPCCHGS